ncbi:hypothetical protein LTR10_020778 [Elasticomyces elasticus]|uniref:Telomeric single stranded DNA binding POT1/Cdc13 domain-containing protein n=1 Tax=Exophiala sideris TaxID=1016849 RepID=A0ABR0J6B6_9EURO|nr:hypothetical protein LTR10_020778 [Elasticomyces elasticus]KAK5028837.1 hypothetical protein LTS07_006217 [Exophiala sideris]KAK5035706.1 hypothetical protein LTR13_005836 [Exophiala sideris]KAK5057341.1 hypothetical protein LTR69_007381 [Exophiala sideris]KAK5181686.1 hypothetical protein LTR44_005885 [Eurotiomycetes sp. CCFEE 6388]
MHDRAVTATPELKPCFAELLRTCVQPPNPVVRVEHVFGKAPRSHRNPDADEPNGNDDHASDGKQSDKHLHTKELLGLQRGDLIRLKKFNVKKAIRLNGHGKVIYLGVESCDWVERELSEESQFESEGGFLREEVDPIDIDMPPKQTARRSSGGGPGLDHSSNMNPLKKRTIESSNSEQNYRKKRQTDTQLSKTTMSTPRKRPRDDTDQSDEDEDPFETITVSPSRMEKRREALHHISQNTLSFQHDSSELETNSPLEINDDAHSSVPALTSVVADEVSAASVRQDLNMKVESPPTVSINAPIHTLSSLLGLSSALPRRSYTCTALGVVSWVSPSIIHKANTPFPPKRHIKIHDPTISNRQAGITVAVYIDARNFLPEVGTIALLRGVVMQRFGDDIILNKYATLAGQADHSSKDWFVTDKDTLMQMGFNVFGMRSWWQDRLRSSKKDPHPRIK